MKLVKPKKGNTVETIGRGLSQNAIERRGNRGMIVVIIQTLCHDPEPLKEPL